MTSRKETESLAQYKVRVIDPISDTYCAAKWLNATIWLGHGQSTSCHHPPAHKIEINEITKNPSAIHNTKHKKLMRKMMLEGQRPAECEYCWKAEDMRRDVISDRVYKTEIHSEEEIAKTVTMPWDADCELKTLEISFDRTCNFACSYCNPAFSTTWVKDIKKEGPYYNLLSDARGHFLDTAPWAESAAETETENPYIQAFWKWWESSLQDNLEEIRITGGEPLMAASVWKLFDWFKNNPKKASRLRYAINSNLVPKPALLNKLIEMSHHVPHLEIYTSNESVGAQSEYIRDGMNYKQWLSNIERLIVEGNIYEIHVMMTINSLCLDSITEFLDDTLAIKRKYGVKYCDVSVNILRFPGFQSCAILPEKIKQIYKQRIQQWFELRVAEDARDMNNRPLLNESERAQIQRLIDYLDVVKTPHKNTSDTKYLYNDFREFYEQYDFRRGKNFKETFPGILAEFIDSIQLVHGDMPKVFDPATTEAGYVSDEILDDE